MTDAVVARSRCHCQMIQMPLRLKRPTDTMVRYVRGPTQCVDDTHRIGLRCNDRAHYMRRFASIARQALVKTHLQKWQHVVEVDEPDQLPLAQLLQRYRV